MFMESPYVNGCVALNQESVIECIRAFSSSRGTVEGGNAGEVNLKSRHPSREL